VTLNEEQRTKIQQTVLSGRDVPRVDRVDFSVNVGIAVPERVHVVAVPQTLIEIHPEWRGYEYFVVRDEIVIVDHSRKIVAMVLVGSGSASTTTETRSTSGAVSGGVDIHRVQQVLIEKGFYHGRVDGVLGTETKQALIEFQRKQGMNATGEIDVRTSEALGISGGTEGRSGQQQGRSEPNAEQRSGAGTSGQAGSSRPSDNAQNPKGNATQNNNQSRPSTSGQGGNASNANPRADDAQDKDKAKDKTSPSTSGQGSRPSAGENKSSGNNTNGQSTRPQNQSAPGNAGNANDRDRKPQQ